MTLLLAGDIGGTKTILRLVEASQKPSLNTICEEKYRSGDFPDLVPMVQQFLLKANTQTPEKACFAIAGPVVQNTAKLTNLVWFLDSERLQQELGISEVTLINDFAAVGYGVLGLDNQDLLTLQAGKPNPEAPIAIIGAGITGVSSAAQLVHQSLLSLLACPGDTNCLDKHLPSLLLRDPETPGDYH